MVMFRKTRDSFVLQNGYFCQKILVHILLIAANVSFFYLNDANWMCVRSLKYCIKMALAKKIQAVFSSV